MDLRRTFRRASGNKRDNRERWAWISVQDAPSVPDPLPSFRFFAVLGTWMESDVVGACVSNAFTQGCERVYLVDNDSPDDTVDRALDAGAVLARSFATEAYDEAMRMRIMNDVVDEVSTHEPDDHIWWLWLDADEFAHGPRGRRLSDHLGALDRRFRIVGTRYFNHYPSAEPYYVEGHHPIDEQPLCEELRPPFCPLRHRKHPLQRWDRSGPKIECLAGFHKATCDVLPLVEPSDGAFVHHFPFRGEAFSRRRLDVLCGVGAEGVGRAREDDPATAHMLPRYRSLEAVYSQRWDEVENFMPGKRSGVAPVPWTSLVDEADTSIARWY
jgi:hypothetical protein